MSFLLFYVPFPDEESAHRISDELLQKQLIACVNIHPIQSAYWWQGALERAHEWVAMLKTTHALEQVLETALLDLHPYDTPCILRTEVSANTAYEQWIAEVTATGLHPR